MKVYKGFNKDMGSLWRRHKDVRQIVSPVVIALLTAALISAPRSEASDLMAYIPPESYAVDLPEVIETPEPYVDPDIPVEVQAAAQKYGEAYGLSPELLEAVAFYESSYRPSVVAGDCVGLMQVNPVWHRDRMARIGVTDEALYTYDGSMAVAADYLAELFAQHDNVIWVLMTYNGDRRADAYLRCDSGASSYARLVRRMAEELEVKHAKAQE